MQSNKDVLVGHKIKIKVKKLIESGTEPGYSFTYMAIPQGQKHLSISQHAGPSIHGALDFNYSFFTFF